MPHVLSGYSNFGFALDFHFAHNRVIDGFGVGVQPAHKTVLLVYQDHPGSHGLVAEFEAHNDDFVALFDQVCGSAIHADNAGPFLSLDHIGFKARA